MKKTYTVEVDCANCANKIQRAIEKLPGVLSANMDFMAGRLILEWQEDTDRKALEEEIRKVGRRIEPDFQLL